MGEMAEYHMDLAMEEQAKWEAENKLREDALEKMDKQYAMGNLKWKTQHDGRILVKKMTNEHINNCINMILKNDFPQGEISERWVEIFNIELEIRK